MHNWYSKIFQIEPWPLGHGDSTENSYLYAAVPKWSFLNTIWFCVNVPVLSLSKYEIRPSSSGIVVERATVPGMSL